MIMQLKVLKSQNKEVRDINIPIIVSPEVVEGTYPEKIVSCFGHLILTCLHIKDVSPDPNHKQGCIYIGAPHRKSLSIELNKTVDISPTKKPYKLNQKNMPLFDLHICNIEGSSRDKIQLSKTKLEKLIPGQVTDICINNGVYVCMDTDTGRFIQFSISLANDTENICYYNGEHFEINNVTMSAPVKTKCIFLEHSTKQNIELLKSVDLARLGIGGLKTQVVELLRRVFASRACEPEMVQALGINHVKGVLLYGPPGTGKTLIARQLGKMLNSVPPIIVNGPEIMSKYVGESSENIRKLFAEAEREYKDKGEYSQLHVIIFDEFDAIAGKRTSGDSVGTQVGNQIVNQLLSKMDGVDSLNNILVFGLTNMRELIDPALLRPGRFEVQLEIGIPDQKSRSEIFDIHLSKYKEQGALSKKIHSEKLAELTDNFTGAEIAGVVRNATTFAICRQINDSPAQNFKLEKSASIQILAEDLLQAIDDTDPMFGRDTRILDTIVPVDFQPRTNQVKVEDKLMPIILEYLGFDPKYSGQSLKLLITGKTRTGKSTTSVYLSKKLKVSNITYLSNFDLIGQSDNSKTSKLKELFLKGNSTETSVIIMDDIDTMMEMSDTKRGFIFNNTMLQTLKTIWSKTIKNRVIFICTSETTKLLDDVKLSYSFHEQTQLL